MTAYEVPLNTLGKEVRTVTVDDQSVWTDPIAECGMDCRVIEPLSGKVTLLPQDGGCLVRGELKGKIALPCNRCMEDAVLAINDTFTSFEPYPGPDDEGQKTTADSSVDSLILKRNAGGVPILNLSGLLWEEFVLSLPIKPLCRDNCKGLCPQCGKNLNEGPCSCVQEEGDPRMAALHGVTLKRN